MTASELRRDLSRRNLEWARELEHELTYGEVPAVVHAEQMSGGHGNFHPASWRRIQARASWRRRLEKTYTAGGRMARRHDRWRGELECATSSDALLMNIFCFPGVLRRSAMTRLLGLDRGEIAVFGVRVRVALLNNLVDRTEVDMRVADLLVEAKLTEGGFQTARSALLMRYRKLEEIFDVEDLPRNASGEFESYQLIRGVLAAEELTCRFAVIVDARRPDLLERWFAVLRAVRTGELRSRMQLLTWQEIAACSPSGLRRFLAVKYGISSSAEMSEIKERPSCW